MENTTEGFPSAPAGAVPPSVPRGGVGADAEDIETVGAPGDGGGQGGEDAAEGLPDSGASRSGHNVLGGSGSAGGGQGAGECGQAEERFEKDHDGRGLSERIEGLGCARVSEDRLWMMRSLREGGIS